MGKDFIDSSGRMYLSLSVRASDALMAHLRLLEAFVGEKCGFVEQEWDGNIGVDPEQMHRFAAALAGSLSGAPPTRDVVVTAAGIAPLHDVFIMVYKGPAVVWMAVYYAAFGRLEGGGYIGKWLPEAIRYADHFVKTRIH